MATSLLLARPSFNVQVDIVHAYFKANLTSNYDGLLAQPEALTVIFKADYVDADASAANTYWSGLNSSSFNPTTSQLIQDRIFANQQFGTQLVLQIETDNVLAGLTVSQITGQLQDYALLLSMLNSGSIPTALAQAQNLQPMDGMTQARIDGYVAKIKTYLGVS